MSQQDVSHLSQNMNTGTEGVRGLLQSFQKGTAEMQSLLTNEVDVVLECRVCRTMFRSVANLVSHKKQYCKTKFTAVSANSASLWQQFLMTQSQVEQKTDEDEEDGDERKKNKNIIKIINRKIQDVVIPVPGSKDPLIIPTLPRIGSELPVESRLVGLASALLGDKNLPSGRTAVCFPQDPHTRSKAMKLRNPRDNILSRYSAELPPNELAALHKISRFNRGLVDGATLKCTHPNCADIAPFKNFSIFGYHCGMKHSYVKQGKISCYLCNHTISKWSNYFNHYRKVHGAVKAQHVEDREDDPDREKTVGKKGRRSRSLSPDMKKEENEEEEERMVEKEESPPVIEPIDLDETNGDEEDEDEAPPTLTRMSRNRSRTLRVREATVTPVKIIKLPKEKKEETLRDPTPPPIRSQSQEDRKREMDVKRVMNTMLKKVEEMMGEKTDVSQVRLFGRKKKLRGRAAYMEKQRQLLKMQERERVAKTETPDVVESPEPEEESPQSSPDEQKTELEEDTPPKEGQVIKRRKRRTTEVIFDDQADLSGPRPSRAKKRPDWMESYLLDTDKGKTKRDEDSADPSQMTPPVTPQKPVLVLPKSESPVDMIRPKGRPPGSYKIRRTTDGNEESFASRASETPPIVSGGSSRRKQDMNVARDTSEDGKMLIRRTGEPISQPGDLSTVPVLLSNLQKTVFFSGLKLVGNGSYSNAHGEPIGPWKCDYCHATTATLKEGRRHMVSHIRVHRLQCSLCHIGAFFCTDMRLHLQEGKCDMMHKIKFSLKPTIPLMSKSQADSLTRISDMSAPGRVVFTRDPIISVTNPRPHFPDAQIEEQIIGRHRKNLIGFGQNDFGKPYRDPANPV